MVNEHCIGHFKKSCNRQMTALPKQATIQALGCLNNDVSMETDF